jgi:hypothetical protein
MCVNKALSSRLPFEVRPQFKGKITLNPEALGHQKTFKKTQKTP